MDVGHVESSRTSPPTHDVKQQPSRRQRLVARGQVDPPQVLARRVDR